MTTNTAAVLPAEEVSLGAFILAKDPAMRRRDRNPAISGHGMVLMEVSCTGYAEMLIEVARQRSPDLIEQIVVIDGDALGPAQVVALKEERFDYFRLSERRGKPAPTTWEPDAATWVVDATERLEACARWIRISYPVPVLRAKLLEMKNRRLVNGRASQDPSPLGRITRAATAPEASSVPAATAPMKGRSRDLVLDPPRFAVAVGGRETIFDGKTHEQYTLLRILADNRGRCVTPERLGEPDAPWHGKHVSDEALESAVKRLRASLGEPLRRLAKCIHTRRISGRVHVILEWPPKSSAPRKRGASRAKPK